jgi:anti-anti-sigma factor
MLDVAVQQHPGTVTLCRIEGELVAREAPILRRAGLRLARSESITIDLRGVTRLDSPGLAALAGLLRRARLVARRVDLRNVPPLVHARLRAAGFDRLVPIAAVGEAAAG